MHFKLSFVPLIAASLALAQPAGARPQKLDYHSSVCQRISGTQLLYDNEGFTTSAAKTVVVCPFANITFPLDGASTRISFKVRYRSVPTTTVTMKCDLRTQGTTFVSIPALPSSVGTSIAASGTATVTLPTMSDSDPASLHLYCEMPVDSWLGTIQIMLLAP